jgi:hypothetical protein
MEPKLLADRLRGGIAGAYLIEAVDAGFFLLGQREMFDMSDALILLVILIEVSLALLIFFDWNRSTICALAFSTLAVFFTMGAWYLLSGSTFRLFASAPTLFYRLSMIHLSVLFAIIWLRSLEKRNIA